MSMLHDDAGNSEETSRKSLVEKLEEAIDANLTNEQFGVDNLAHLMGMSRSSLHRKLSKSANVSTSQFIREHRLKRALEILKTEDVTASEVAYRVGFSSATYFSTSFHKYYGYPPGEVKSRDHKEGDRPVKNEISESTIKEGRKRILGLVFIILTVLAAAFYYNSNSKGNGDIQIVEDKTNDKSIAVLPFKNWTGSPDLEYVSDGMTDAVTTRLTKISSINKVTPFTSTLIYKESAKAAKEIAAELGVETLLQGNLQISGDQIKINLQLIDGNSNAHIWSEEFVREWKSDEIFKIQSEVVEGIAANMNAAIAKDELVAIQKIPTNSKLAYSYYLQAEFQRNKANEQSYKNAIELYGKAIEVDPKFFGAYVSMARTYNWGGLVWGIYDEQAAWTKSKALLQKALEIYPDNREALNELYSGYYFFDWNFKLVEEYYQEVLAGGALKTIPDFCIDYAKKNGKI